MLVLPGALIVMCVCVCVFYGFYSYKCFQDVYPQPPKPKALNPEPLNP